MKCWTLAVLLFLPAVSLASAPDPVTVEARHEANHVVFLARFNVAVVREQAWEVMVDFENMTHFLPFLSSSKVLVRDGNRVRVAQTGLAPVAFLRISYESVRDIELLPFTEIRARSVGGDAGFLQSVATLTAHGSQTEVSYRADWWPNSSLVAGLGTEGMRDLVGKQFTAMQQEMLRRQQNRRPSIAHQ